MYKLKCFIESSDDEKIKSLPQSIELFICKQVSVTDEARVTRRTSLEPNWMEIRKTLVLPH